MKKPRKRPHRKQLVRTERQKGGCLKYVIIVFIILIGLGHFFGGEDNNETAIKTHSSSKSENTQINPIVESTQHVEPYQSLESNSEQFEVHFIDVGQGDAILVICDGHFMLVDGGPGSYSSKIYSYLKNIGADHLDIIVATHPDSDHIGGLAAALNYASVDLALSPVEYDDSESFQDFKKYLSLQDVQIHVPSVGEEYTLGNAIVTVLGPREISNYDNNNSIVLRIEHNKNSFLLAADAEKTEEDDIINSMYDIKSTVLKVGHHGSASSTSDEWLNSIHPDYVVVSCGYANEYGHPTEVVLDKLKQKNIKLLRTDLQGDIIFREENGALTYSVQKNADAEMYVPGYVISEIENSERSIPVTEDSETIEEKTIHRQIEKSYIININTRVFHSPGCRSVSRMKDKNKKEYTGSREDLISQGYKPCGNCHP